LAALDAAADEAFELHEEQIAKAKMPRILTVADQMTDYVERLERRREAVKTSGITGVSTGISQLDRAIGGVRDITILGGRTQVGKTSLAIQICLAALKTDPHLGVAYILGDNMSADDVVDQAICQVAQVDYQNYVTSALTTANQVKLAKATDWLRNKIGPRMGIINKLPAGNRGCSHEQMFELCAGLEQRIGASRLLVIIDMFDNIPLPRIMGGESELWKTEVARIVSDPDRWRLEQIVNLSAESRDRCQGGWPILVLAKIRKSGSANHELALDDLLGGVELAYTANTILFLLPKRDAEGSTTPISLRVMKARHGQTTTIPLLFDHAQSRFDEAVSPAQGKRVESTRKPRGFDHGIDPLTGMAD
jgi:replicative DNA helicase